MMQSNEDAANLRSGSSEDKIIASNSKTEVQNMREQMHRMQQELQTLQVLMASIASKASNTPTNASSSFSSPPSENESYSTSQDDNAVGINDNAVRMDDNDDNRHSRRTFDEIKLNCLSFLLKYATKLNIFGSSVPHVDNTTHARLRNTKAHFQRLYDYDKVLGEQNIRATSAKERTPAEHLQMLDRLGVVQKLENTDRKNMQCQTMCSFVIFLLMIWSVGTNLAVTAGGGKRVTVERKEWLDNGVLPTVAVNYRSNRRVTNIVLGLKVQTCEIPKGDFLLINCTDITSQLVDCKTTTEKTKENEKFLFRPVGGKKEEAVAFDHYYSAASCLPEGIEIQGVFGHNIFKFVVIQFLYPDKNDAGVNISSLPPASIRSEANLFIRDHRASLTHTTWNSFWINFDSSVQQHVEVEMSKLNIAHHGWDGLGPGKSFDPLASSMSGLAYSGQWKRQECWGCNSGWGKFMPLSIFLFSSLRQENIAVVPQMSALELIESTGAFLSFWRDLVLVPLLTLCAVQLYRGCCSELKSFTKDVSAVSGNTIQRISSRSERRKRTKVSNIQSK